MPSSREFFQPRDQTQVSHIAGGFFTVWATREAHDYWSGWPTPSPGDLPDPGIEAGSAALQADSFPAELPGKPKRMITLGFHIHLECPPQDQHTYQPNKLQLTTQRFLRWVSFHDSTQQS